MDDGLIELLDSAWVPYLLWCSRWLRLDHKLGLSQVEAVGIEQIILTFVKVEMITGHDAVITLINSFVFINESFAMHKSLHPGFS